MTYPLAAKNRRALRRTRAIQTYRGLAWFIALASAATAGLAHAQAAPEEQGTEAAPEAGADPEAGDTGEAAPAPSTEGGLDASASADLSLGGSADDGELGLPSNDSGGADDSGAFLVAGKVGGIASFNGLDPFVQVGIELGWVFGGTDRQIGAMLQVEYAVPPASGEVTEDGFDPPRVPGGSYKWELIQKELVFQPTFLYRLTGLSDMITPYAGIGPRLYFLETVVNATANGEQIGDTYERSMKFGVGVPLGAELALGPGGLFAELLFQWGPFKHDTTGDTHLGGGSLFLGYRALL